MKVYQAIEIGRLQQVGLLLNLTKTVFRICETADQKTYVFT